MFLNKFHFLVMYILHKCQPNTYSGCVLNNSKLAVGVYREFLLETHGFEPKSIKLETICAPKIPSHCKDVELNLIYV